MALNLKEVKEVLLAEPRKAVAHESPDSPPPRPCLILTHMLRSILGQEISQRSHDGQRCTHSKDCPSNGQSPQLTPSSNQGYEDGQDYRSTMSHRSPNPKSRSLHDCYPLMRLTVMAQVIVSSLITDLRAVILRHHWEGAHRRCTDNLGMRRQ